MPKQTKADLLKTVDGLAQQVADAQERIRNLERDNRRLEGTRDDLAKMLEKARERERGHELRSQYLEGWQARVMETERGPIPQPDSCIHEWFGQGREAYCHKCGQINRGNQW